MAASSEDRILAEQLRSQEPNALAQLAFRCQILLRDAWSEFTSEVPRCRLSLEQLLGPLGRAVGEAYLASAQEDEIPLARFAAQLRLKDLLLVSAFLAGDAASAKRLQAIINTQVRPMLFKRWSREAPTELLFEITSGLAGDLLQPIGKGKNVGLRRVATYQGTASLQTWLFASACRLVQTKLRERSRGPVAASDREEFWPAPAATTQPDQAMLKEADQRGEKLREKLVSILQQVLQQMPDRRRITAILHWEKGMAASQIADSMGVSRPAITEHLNLARSQIQKATEEIAREIALEANRNPSEIMTLLLEQLGYLLRESPKQREEAS
jgi:RNA polymerase sigma factor (sigma-70 family)